MSISESLFYFIIVMMLGFLIFKTGWKLRYLMPLVFVTIALIIFLLFVIFLPDYVVHSQFLLNGKVNINEPALTILVFSIGGGALVVFLLTLATLAIRYDVF